MNDLQRAERIGTALHALASELVAERQRVRALRRENRQLRAELEQLRGERRLASRPPVDQPDGRTATGRPANVRVVLGPVEEPRPTLSMPS